MNYNISISIFTLSLILVSRNVYCNLEHLELLNIASWRLEKQFQTNFEAMVRDLGPKSGGYISGILSRMNPFGSKAKPEPQKDLEELAQIYGAMNSADTAALYFLNKECRSEGLLDPKTDPILCSTYPGYLIKQTQSRISNVNSRLVKSKGLILCPPRWGHHAVTVQSLLKDIDPKNLLEYRVNTAITKALVGDDVIETQEVKDESVEKEYAEQMATADVKSAETADVKPSETVEQSATVEKQTQAESQPESQSQAESQAQPQSQVQSQSQAESQVQSQPQVQVQVQSQPDLQQPNTNTLPPPPPAQIRPVYPSEQILNNVIGQMGGGGANSGLNLSIKI